MKLMIVVGARPNFMKAAPILAAIKRRNDEIQRRSAASGDDVPEELIQPVLVHTGQHYGEVMSDAFFDDLNIPQPDVHLGAGSGTHAAQTADIMKRFEEVLLRELPDVLVIVGDVNSTLACSLVAAKISFDSKGSRPCIAHVEAGLRSFDRSMPEEINRIVTDHVSDLFFVTEQSGVQNLRNEGISADKIHFVGNTMIDSLLTFNEKADASTVLDELGLRTPKGKDGTSKSIRRYCLLTLHRPSNVDNRDAFLAILDGLEELSANCPIVFPVHPRTEQRIKEFGMEPYIKANASKIKEFVGGSGNTGNGILLTSPLGYLDFLCLMKNAAIVVTDSGGIQEETTCLGIPCVTVRENTERPVTVTSGTNIVAGTGRQGIQDAIRRQLMRKCGVGVPEHWDGQASTRIVDVLFRAHAEKCSPRHTAITQPDV